MHPNRRTVLSSLSCIAAATTFVWPANDASAQAMSGQVSRMTAYAFSFDGLDGKPIRLADHAGKPILVINTASQCGYTPQYAGLQDLWTRYRDRGLFMVAVPSNDFGGQEPGGATDIEQTVHGQYHVGFPVAAKVAVRGANQHPFYKWAAAERPLEVPRWNFHKYLIGRDGRIAASFPSAVEPMDGKLLAALGRQLESAPT
jgi:glutathione peroxidase